MIIEVTEEDIRKGKRGDNLSCPIALASKRCLPVNYVGPLMIRFGFPHKWVNLPPQARNFIHTFDEGCPVKSFSFDLPVEDV